MIKLTRFYTVLLQLLYNMYLVHCDHDTYLRNGVACGGYTMCYYDLMAQNNACMSQYGSKTIIYSYNNGIKTISTEMNDHKLWRNSVCYVDRYDCKKCINPLDGGM